MAEIETPNPKELEEIGKKGFTRKVALATAFFAVGLALASLGGNHAMKEMLLAQQQASDQWAYYQAKSIREHLYNSQKMILESELDLLSGDREISSDRLENAKATIKSLGDQGSKYSKDKKEIEEEARKLEKERDINRSRDPYFDYAEVLLQIAIVMATVSIIAISRKVFVVSCIFALLGVVMCANGYLQIFELPFLH